MITAFIDMVGTLMIIPLLAVLREEVRRERPCRRVARLVVRDRAAAQRADVGTLLRSIRPPARAHGRAGGVGDRVRRSSRTADSLWLLFLSRLVQGVRRRNGERDPGLRGRRGRSPRSAPRGWDGCPAATNAGVALGPVHRVASVDHVRPHAPGIHRRRRYAVAQHQHSRGAISSGIARHGRSPRERNIKPGRSRRGGRRASSRTRASRPRALIWIYAIGIGAVPGRERDLSRSFSRRASASRRNDDRIFLHIHRHRSRC